MNTFRILTQLEKISKIIISNESMLDRENMSDMGETISESGFELQKNEAALNKHLKKLSTSCRSNSSFTELNLCFRLEAHSKNLWADK